MAGESQLPPGSLPDPTVLVTEAIERQARADRDWVLAQLAVITARLTAMDEANRVLHETVTRTPTDIQSAISALKELVGVELASIAEKFVDGKIALDAAFAAQEKLGIQSTNSTQASMTKTEDSIKDSIDKLSVLFGTTTNALSDKIDDNKTRIAAQDTIINGIVSRVGGIHEQRAEQRQSSGAVYAAVGFVVMLGLAAITVFGFLAANGK